MNIAGVEVVWFVGPLFVEGVLESFILMKGHNERLEEDSRP